MTDAATRRRWTVSAGLVAMVTTGIALGGLLIGYEPVGDDPDRLYRPIKSELARALREGELPFWSDRFGLGVPLIAESHVAAFYPPNLILYRVLDVAAAYRLSMWLHCVALAGTTYLYARRLGLLPWGAALSSITFSLCAFQAIHATHEPFYSALPFLPLAMYFGDQYLDARRSSALAWLALVWGAQLTLGHFQLQMWTAGLVLFTGLWRVVSDGGSRSRAFGLAAALAGGAAIAAVQLVLSWDWAQLVGSTRRSLYDLMKFPYVAAHWSELVLPRLFHGLQSGPEGPYWLAQNSSHSEANFYIGTIPVLLACVGVSAGRNRRVAPWLVLIPLSFALATLPWLWPRAYAIALRVPGLGYFRAPARYTMITSFGLALLAGRGLDAAIPKRRFTIGVSLALVCGGAAVASAYFWTRTTAYQMAAADGALLRSLGLAAIGWTIAVAALFAWRAAKLASPVILLIATTELTALYYGSTTTWARSIHLPDESPVLRRLSEEPHAGTVAGRVDDLPVRAGHPPAYPYLGMQVPPPASALEFAQFPEFAATGAPLLRRMGVTHGVWHDAVSGPDVEMLYEGPDAALDRVVHKDPGDPDHWTWRLVRYAGSDPAAHVAVRAVDAPDLRSVLFALTQPQHADAAIFLPGDRPPDAPGARAREARILRWAAFGGEVAHDGPCDVVIRRTFAPGWIARLDGSRDVLVFPVNGGLQGVRLPGAGVTRIALRYDPPHWRPALAISSTSLGVVLLILVLARRRDG